MNADKNFINLTHLCSLHGEAININQKLAIQELFSVCTNDSFLGSIHKARVMIMKEMECELPIEDDGWFFQIRTDIYEENKWNWYQNILEDIRLKHGLIGEKYNWNPFEDYHFQHEIENNVRALTDFYANEKNKITKSVINKKAKIETRTNALRYDFSCLESIIFYNDPVKNMFFSGWPNADKGGLLKIDTDLRTDESYIHGKFYLHSSKQDMIDVINRHYRKISEKREKIFNIALKKDYQKENLSKLFLAYVSNMQGKTISQIAIEIDKSNPDSEATLDSVKKILSRIKKESKQYDLRKGQQK